MTLVSVLMPAYRHEQFVRLAVESVLGQTHGDLELIVVDDASDDGTWDVLQSLRDERLRLCRHEVNQGAHATLNEALGMARGDFVAILNSDDVYSPRRIERLLAEVAAWGGDEGLAFSDVAFVDDGGQPVPGHPRASAYEVLHGFCRELPPAAWFLAGNPAITTSNFFFSRALGQRLAGFAPLRYTHDWDWALRAGQGGRLAWIPECLLQYRVHAGNTLSEDDRWRHVHENSYVQARALLTLGDHRAAQAPELVKALLRNDSLHPVSLLCFLTWGLAGTTDARMLEAAAGADGRWPLQAVAAAGSYPVEIFHSLRSWLERYQAIQAQAALLDDRWHAIQHMNGEIADRDACIAEQRAILADKDRCIAGQAAMIEERWNAIQQMGREIADRDAQIANRDRQLAEFNDRPLVRLSKGLERLRARLRWP